MGSGRGISSRLLEKASQQLSNSCSDELTSWLGALEGMRNDDTDISLDAVLESQSESGGGSLPFKALASNSDVYWIKLLGNKQSPRVLIAELVVSLCGQMILAPVCHSEVIRIPDEFDGDVLDNGTTLMAGIALGSRNVPNTSFGKWFEPQHRERDDNRKRHAGYYALYDWCWGDDMQWLYDVSHDWKTYSHDHGLFLPGGTDWNPETLVESVNETHEIDSQSVGLDDTELRRIADRLDSISSPELLQVVASIPQSWPVTDRELETLGWFLFRRASEVAVRLRVLADKNAS